MHENKRSFEGVVRVLEDRIENCLFSDDQDTKSEVSDPQLVTSWQLFQTSFVQHANGVILGIRSGLHLVVNVSEPMFDGVRIPEDVLFEWQIFLTLNNTTMVSNITTNHQSGHDNHNGHREQNTR